MRSLKQAWFLFWKNKVLWWIVLFGFLSLVPLVFGTVLSFFSYTAGEAGAPNESIVLAFLAALFFLLLIFYQAFVQSLLIGAANNLVKKKKLSFMIMFKDMRPLYWRVVSYSFIVFALLIPSFILSFLAATLVTSNSSWVTFLFGFSLVWLFLVLLALLWTPTFLPRFGIVKAIKNAWKEFATKPVYTLVTLVTILLLSVFVGLVVLGIEYLVGDAVIWNILARVLNFVLAVYAMLYLFSRKTLKKK